MKELIKVRKSWLLNPATKIEQSKKIKKRIQEENNQDWRNYIGDIDQKDLEEMEDLEDENNE